MAINETTDVERVASEWLRALRGKRSQVAFSRRLGYGSNIAYRWEAGHCWPTAARTFAAVQRLGGDAKQAVARFYRREPAWLDAARLDTAAGVAQLLSDLRGKTSIQTLAEKTGLNRFSISRWLKGEADPPLPAFLNLIEVTSLRLLDFLAAFTDPARMPSVASEWQRLEEARESAYTHPWSQAVLRGLELKRYRALKKHRTGWLSEHVGTTREQEQSALALLVRTGQVRWNETHFELASVRAVDTRVDPDRARALKAYWGNVAMERIKSGRDGLFAYNLSAVSRADLNRLEELQRAHYREMSRIIAASTPSECVVLYAAQLFPLSNQG